MLLTLVLQEFKYRLWQRFSVKFSSNKRVLRQIMTVQRPHSWCLLCIVQGQRDRWPENTIKIISCHIQCMRKNGYKHNMVITLIQCTRYYCSEVDHITRIQVATSNPVKSKYQIQSGHRIKSSQVTELNPVRSQDWIHSGQMIKSS